MIDYVKLWNDLRTQLADAIADCDNEIAEQAIERETYETVCGLMDILEDNANG